MKVLVDAQLPPALASWLRDRGVDAEHVAETGLLNAGDDEIWAHALGRRQVIISKDRDFAQWAVARSPAAQVVWLRMGNRDTATLLRWLEDAWPRIVETLAEGARVVEAGR